MRLFIRKSIVYLVVCAIVIYTLPGKTSTAGELPQGSGSADEAAAPRLPAKGHVYGVGGYAFAYSDTTEYEFPEEEGKHLYRDIAVFVVVTVFLAFFIIKVFIEEDEPPEEDGGGGGKPIPTSMIPRHVPSEQARHLS